MSTSYHDYGDNEWLTASPPPVPSEVEVCTTSDWELKPLVIDSPTSPDPPSPTETDTSTLHAGVMESPASPEPTPTKDNELTSTMPVPLEREDDPEFSGYGAHTSPVSSDADTDSVSELRFTPAVQTLPKASASMGGPRSHTLPTARWPRSSDDDDNYRGVVDDCADAIVRHVRCVMNTCCRARVANEVRACFGVLMREAMEPAFLDDIINIIVH